mmetsp:Transcript_496/g.545  ORF Transcript_496/g.545 Transcript_496/m.545 type:complete len:140 (-) Transcript_496:44-463(-)
MAVPVLLSGGQMIVLIGIERFILTTHNSNKFPLHDESNFSELQALEGRMRDLIMSVHAMERREQQKYDASFQIQLKPKDNRCPKLIKGMSEGKWYQASRLPSSSQGNKEKDTVQREMIRPIQDTCSEGFNFSFYSSVCK